MPLSRTERIKFKSQMIDEMNTPDSGWDFERTNMMLREFDLEPVPDGHWDGPAFADIIANISDADLIEMYSIVTGINQDEIHDAVESADSGNWKPGYVRLFISHSTQHRAFIGEVANELAVVGIHGFVAHDSMAYSKPWQAQIEQGLRSMQAFVSIVHPEFLDSRWCNQEVGWALGRRTPRFAIRMGVDPAGFIGSDQWPSGHNQSSREVASIISTWASGIPELGETMTDGLFSALSEANNYIDAGATAGRIATLSSLTDLQWDQLNSIYWKNDQVRGGALPTKALRPFYYQHGRTWPPSKAAAETGPADPWAVPPSGETRS
ncbi:toll/interleukin-1 receptor domain-containing protein [Arthrobacter cryoconiti]|uniref:Toll/interleukin-1 receptor domain-containing protein n=1 Tax=Arthrobacter cryoconiti TaxID=748907 RepID=A0ABV8R4B3_9MICC|nr:toll/interleukin-1 receptor domain-containing protein [Arthrobacter cryoconiti]MCC9069364.1 toll/interleukin-1 receptor domain-containing protein [Arthrobacter cryoconiti]